MSSRRLPALVGLLVLVLGVAAVLLGGAVERRPVAPARAGLPRTVPGWSHLTADVAQAPVGRALVLHLQGAGVGFGDGPQAVLVGADGRSVRTLDEAVRRNAPAAGGPAPSVLSPDGTTVAIGDLRVGAPRPDLALVDLATGETRTVLVPDTGTAVGFVPLAWSSDGTQLAQLLPVPAPDTTGSTVGRVVVVDVGTRLTHEVPGAEDAVAATFSRDGSRLAVQAADRLLLLDPLTGEGSALAVPFGRTLAGGQAWSPDGAFLALTDGAGRLEFLPVVPDAVVPTAVEAAGDVLGWLSPTELLHLAAGSGPEDDLRVVRTDLETGASSTWTTIPTADGDLGVADVSLATGLLADAVAVPGEGGDRGPWPLPARLGLVLLGAVLAVPATVGLRRRAGAVRQVVTVPEWARDATPG